MDSPPQMTLTTAMEHGQWQRLFYSFTVNRSKIGKQCFNHLHQTYNISFMVLSIMIVYIYMA